MLGFAFVSCGSDNDSPDPDPYNDKDNSYSITVGGTEYSKSYSYEAKEMGSFYNDKGDGEKVITIIIQHEDPDVIPLFLTGSFQLQNDQVLPLSSSANAASVLGITPDPNHPEMNYEAVSGTCQISNLEVNNVAGAEVAGFDLEFNGVFDIGTTEEVEQITITGTIHFAPYGQ